MIYILTDPVRTGKTTALLNWAADRQDTDGVLCPDDALGKRYFLQLRTQQKSYIEATPGTEQANTLSVGRFHFLKSAFDEANAYMISVAGKKDYSYLIIDELGKLELENTGLHHAASNVVKNHEFDEKHHIILVVRDTLLDEILSHYNIKLFRLVGKEELKALK